MKHILILLLTIGMLSGATPVFADGHHGQRDCEQKDPLGAPHAGIGNRESGCTNVPAGELSCDPPAGKANDYSVVVGAADSGTFVLQAVGTNLNAEWCEFVIFVDPSTIRFNEGYTIGLLAPYGGASNAVITPCYAAYGTDCTAEASFDWWRAVHGVTFDVPYELYVNGVLVDKGEVHYYDPPAIEDVTGGPVVASL